MARRGGKAANRRARRRQQLQRPGPRPESAAASPEPIAPSGSDATSSLGAMPDAFEKADAEVRAATVPPMTATPIRGRSRPADPRVMVGGSSRLGERAVAEYHYVLRDLRNIGVLVVVLAVLLAVATFAVNGLGIGRA
jgi:hypothetical protein